MQLFDNPAYKGLSGFFSSTPKKMQIVIDLERIEPNESRAFHFMSMYSEYEMEVYRKTLPS